MVFFVFTLESLSSLKRVLTVKTLSCVLQVRGDVVGHRSLFAKTNYLSTATMIEDGIVCFVSKKTINELVRQNPQLAGNIMETISAQLGAAESRISSMVTKTLRERFAQCLLVLADSFGIKDNETVKIALRLSREELASIIGGATENIIRLMSEFKKAGWISEDQKEITLLDLPAIETEARVEKYS